MEPKKKCFVVMGFGEKTDLATGRTLDLDKTYRVIIKKAVEESGLECIRADDVIHSGLIDKPMYEMLLEADVVIADLSTANPNAIYELGVRHALRPHTTIVIAEKHFKFPFDLTHLVIRPYEHLGKGIDVEEADRVIKDLKAALEKLLREPDVDSPVYAFLPQLHAWNVTVKPIVAASLRADSLGEPPSEGPPPAARSAARSVSALDADASSAAPAHDASDNTTWELMQMVRQAKSDGDWALAVSLLQRVRRRRPGDEYVTQQLALATYKCKQPNTKDALLAAHAIMEDLQPERSTNPETLGIWGSIHKRLFEETGDHAHLDLAIRALEKGFYVKNDHYNGINLAFLLNVRASVSPPREAVADTVLAERTRRRVVEICEQLLQKSIRDEEGNIDVDETFWVRASLAEALLGSGQTENAAALRQELTDTAPQQWMADSMEEQLRRLSTLLSR